jgi:hypothetical protein
MSSFENVKSGMRPRFISQKIQAKDPEKKITAAKATNRSANAERLSLIHRIAQSAFRSMHGIGSIASERYSC